MSLIVYRASAGSGKTYTLALKYISLALKSGSKGFTHVLAVTFTNKATGEMKDRILEKLYGLSRGLDADFLKDVKKITDLSEQEIQRKSTEMLCYIMNDFDHFRVETIDSFFQSLLTNLAFELGLTRGFKVDLDDKRVISIAVERILRRIDQEEKNGLRRIVKESLIRSLEDGKSWDIAKDLKAFAGKNLFKSEYVNNEKNITDLLNNGDLRKIKESIFKSWSVLKEEKEKALQFVEQWVSDAEGDSSWKKQVVSTVKTFCGYVRENSSKDVSGKVKKAAEDKDALLKNPGCDVALDVKAQQVSDYLEKLVDFYDNGERYGRPYNTCQLAVENLDTLAFMGAISEEINHIVLEENTTLLAKTPLLFKNLVKDDIDQSFVFERAGTTFKHIMIDEFQDTSRVQWNNFEHLVNESTAQGEESLVVGDIKQSIYRWRGGDWNILHGFKDKKDDTFVKNLYTNYRSKPIVVRFNNVFFTKAAYILDQKENSWSVPANWLNEKDGYFVKADNSSDGGNDDNIEFCNLYNDTTQHIKPQYDKPEFINSGYVRLQTFESSITDEEIMAEVFDKVVELNEKYNIDFKNMKMLVRTNNEGVKLIDYFAKRCEEEGVDIKLTSNEAYLFNASPALNALIFAMKRLLAPQDDLQRELFERYYNLLCEKAGKQAFFEDVKNDVEALLQDNEALDEIKSSPLYDLVMMMVQKLRLHDLLVKIDEESKAAKDGLGQSAYLFSFLDKVVDYLNDNSSDLKEFLDYWDETLSSQSITSNSNDAIEILTIHKAKGLAGHTVLIPFAGFSFVKNGRDGMIWCNPKDMSDDSEVKAQLSNLGLIPIKTAASKKVKNSDFKCFYDKELKQMTIDELNSLYVAFTRAKENMFIWSKEPSKNSTEPNAFMLINKFIDDCQVPVEGSEKNRVVEFGQLEYCANEEEGKEKRIVNPFSEDLKPQKVDVMIEQNNVLDLQFCQSKKAANFLFEAKDPNDISEEEKKQAQQNHYIEIGVLMHQMMSLINRTEDVDRAYQQMVYDGLIAEGDSQFLSLKRELKEQIATDKMVKSWFDGTYENFNEKTILLEVKEDSSKAKIERKTKRADRVMVSKDKAIVVDYKFGNHDEAYNVQVQEYMEIIEKLLGLPTEGYLWYVYTKEVFPVPATK